MKIIVFFLFLSFTVNVFSEGRSNRKRKNSKKSTGSSRVEKNTPSSRFSKDLNKFSTKYWLEESSIYSSDSLSYLSNLPNEEVTEKDPKKETKEEKSEGATDTGSKPNPVLNFLDENKKIMLIIGLIIVFAIYRIRNGNSSTSTHSGRIFSKFKDK
ncbi:MAG: hypothetical protein H7A24_07560 [Leptospiraceae bacterium]|nr:hypothetical protein [Leptospiraceae bacterium]MCP5511721.1 hypothetical protein [Leptospiraceae bacterium]